LTDETILRITGISKSFGGVKAVDGVSLSVKKGSITGLIGPNGSGKSTLFNLISGAEKKNSGGSIEFDGKQIDALPPHKRSELGMGRTFQTPRLFPGMTVLENTMVAPQGQRGERPLIAPLRRRWEGQEIELAQKAKDQMTRLEIDKLYGKLTSEISGGQMKLAQLSNALMQDPKMLLLDEPTAGVAPRLAQDIFQSITNERQVRGTTFFIIEHRLEVLFKHVDTIFVMHQGSIIMEDKPEAIVKDKRLAEAYLGI
jgi:ABC-type branched-subunit amino acid transport system ATPase component